MPDPKKIPGLLEQAKGFFHNQGATIFNGVLIVLTFSGESVFRKLSFKCPCSYPQNILYGGAFLFAPAVTLLFAGVLLNNTTWRILQGCCYRSARTKHGCRKAIFYWSAILGQASVAPLAWLFIAFLDGGYYECFRAGDYCVMDQKTCNEYWAELRNQSHPELAAIMSGGTSSCVNSTCVCTLPKNESGYLRAFSQIIAWALIFVTVFMILIVMLVGRCMDRYTYCQNMYIALYQDIEQTVFEQEARARAKRLAEKNVNTFYNKSMRSKLDWDKISIVPLSDFPHYLDNNIVPRKEPYFSPLHQWTKDHNRLEKQWRNVLHASHDGLVKRSDSDPTGLNDGHELKILIDNASDDENDLAAAGGEDLTDAEEKWREIGEKSGKLA